MTISTTSNKVIGLGNGVTTVWPFSFLIQTAAQLVVIYTDADGIETTLPSAQYSVTGLGLPTGGSVTYPLSGSAIVNGTSLTVMRVLPYQQLVSLTGQNNFYPAVVEQGMDTLEMQIQQIGEIAARTLAFGPSVNLSGVSLNLPAPEAGLGLVWNATGTGLINAATVTGVAVSSFMSTVLLAASAAAAQAALGITGSAYLTGVAGTNTITATAPAAITALSAGQLYTLIPANTTTGPATLNFGLGAKSIFYRGFALYRGELEANVPVQLFYDGTQYNIISPVKPVLAAPLAFSAASNPFAGLPGWVRKATLMFSVAKSSGSNPWRLQLGDATGSYATTGYLGTSAIGSDASSPSVLAIGNGFELNTGAAAAVVSGKITFSLENPSTFVWTADGQVSRSDAVRELRVSGVIGLSGVLDRIRVSLTGGDTGASGELNLLLE